MLRTMKQRLAQLSCGTNLLVAHLSAVSAFSILGLPALLSQPAVQGRQLITNGGFEDGLTDWQPDRGHKLVTDSTKAHSGNNCLFGEVTGPNQAHILRRTIQMRVDAIYRFVIWARATKRTKLVLWRRTADRRRYVIAWQKVPNKWRRYEVTFSVEADGPTTLEIVAPSSHGAPAGRMWIDDIALYEIPVPPSVELSAGVGFNDFPVMAATSASRAWAAWISFRDGHDTLQVARVRLNAAQPQIVRTWQVVGGKGTYILHPAIACSPGGPVWLVWAQEVRGNWDIFASRLTPGGPGQPIRLTTHPAVDVHPAAATSDEGLWVAWESNRDNSFRQIYLVQIRGERVGKPERLSLEATDNYAPCVAVLRSGTVWVVWHSFRGDNFDLYARAFDGHNLSPERRLTRCPAMDRDVRAVADGDRLWLAWELASYRGYHLGGASVKRVQIARLDPDGKMLAPQGLTETALWRRAEVPELAVDDRGRLWVAARTPRGQHAGWETMLWCYSGGEWTRPWMVTGRKGMCRRPSIVPLADTVAVCYQADDIPHRWNNVEESASATSRAYMARLDVSSAPDARPLQLAQYQDPDEPFDPAPIRHQRGEDRTGWTITYRGQKLHLYFGDLHEHSDISVCNRTGDETQDQTYQMMRDIVRYDFGGLTDHGYNFNAYLWNHQAKSVRANCDSGRFLTFLAQEWTSTFEKYSDKYPYGYYGHRNLILADPYFPIWFNAWDGKKPPEVWRILTRRGASFIHIPHQLADTGNVPMAWEFHDERIQPVAEIFQGRGSYEYDGCPRQAKRTTGPGWFYHDALAKGIIIGIIAAPDHTGGFGKAAVYAPALEREAILQAIRARHTYGTTSAKIFLDVRVNGLLMGEIGPPPDGKPVRIHVRADCPQPIKSIDVCRNGRFIVSRPGEGKRCDITLVDESPPRRPTYYYVRIIQQDDEIAWSSPVWLGRPRPKL